MRFHVMASIQEVWGSPFPKKSHTMASKYGQQEAPRDAEKEGRVFPTPLHRTNAALQRHKKTIDDISASLPIVNDEDSPNFNPNRVGPSVEKMTNYSRPNETSFLPNVGADFPYAPPTFKEAAYDVKLDRILRMIEQNKTGYETPGSQDMLLYVFTGVFFLFTLDTFVNLGRRLR